MRPAALTLFLATLAGSLLATESRPPTSARGKIDFNRHIRPILSNHCFACHGPDEQARKASLRLDRNDDALKARRRGAAFVAHQPDKSKALERITTEDSGLKMPPPEFGKPLNAEQVSLIRQWIAEGAEWREHWSYTPITRPPLPGVSSPAWPRNGVDHFILARLEKEGLAPMPEASRSTLLRRVTLDLTGLPPTPAELDAFLNDPRPDAYEHAVDRLLASPRFGERWAVHWLDLARYADTNGYHIDNHRDMWLWRDWVIHALNRNMPFDQFVVEQLAGDLLPNATVSQRIASGFQRNVMVNFEGGADPDEYLSKYVVDRVNTFGTVFLGSSLACAECHDHKYDPFTQREFYQLYAFFHQVPEQGLDGQKDNPKPSLKVPTAEQQQRLQELTSQLAATEKEVAAELAKHPLPPQEAPDVTTRQAFIWVDDEVPPGAQAQGDATGWQWTEGTSAPVLAGRRASRRTATGLSQHYFENAPVPLRVGPGDEFFAHVFLDAANPPEQIMLQFNDGSWEHRVYWGASKINWGQEKTPSRVHAGPLPPPGRWVRLQVSAQTVGLPPGSLVSGMAFTQFGGNVYWDQAGILSRFPQGEADFDSFAAWLTWERLNRRSKLPGDLLGLLKKRTDQRKPEDTQRLWHYFVRSAAADRKAAFASLNQREDGLRKQVAEIEAAIPATMVMAELEKPRPTHVLLRGNFQAKGPLVEAEVPSFLPPLPAGVKRDRLALARWLVAPENPLLARVTVNRWWEQLFGHGLVKTTEEFGAQGEWPSHPELLDWLAAEFRSPAHGQPWDIKAFLKLLVTSAAYRQEARVTEHRLRLDPDNRLLSRGPRFRLKAEFIRDQALAVSGLLNGKIGGPSVKPYQPPGLWEQVAFGGEFSAQTYQQSTGADLYRRGLYVYWKRSLPHPSLVAFDAPNRELCTSCRPRTNTPLQALTLLNDPIYVEAARKLAERLLREGGDTDAKRLALAFRLCLCRLPTAAEERRLLSLLAKLRDRFNKDAGAAEALLKVGEAPREGPWPTGELASWSALCNVLLNLDEMVTKE